MLSGHAEPAAAPAQRVRGVVVCGSVLGVAGIKRVAGRRDDNQTEKRSRAAQEQIPRLSATLARG